MGPTLIIVRRAPTEPKTAFAGVILEISFARFMASMATFSEEITPFRPFGRWDLASIVGAQGIRGRVMRYVGCDEGPEHWWGQPTVVSWQARRGQGHQMEGYNNPVSWALSNDRLLGFSSDCPVETFYADRLSTRPYWPPLLRRCWNTVPSVEPIEERLCIR